MSLEAVIVIVRSACARVCGGQLLSPRAVPAAATDTESA